MRFRGGALREDGGIGGCGGALPRALLALGHDVRVALPNYSAVNQEKACAERVGEVTVPIPPGQGTSVGVLASLQIPGVPTYLMDAPKYFHRDSLYGQPDDPLRFGIFCRVVLDFLRAGDWQPEVIHCNDWQTALIPVWLRTGEHLRDVATLFTIHNFAYQGVFDPSVIDELGLDSGLLEHARAGVLRPGELHEGRAGLCRLAQHRESDLREGDSDAGIWRAT